jgi:hypothetical protein
MEDISEFINKTIRDVRVFWKMESRFRGFSASERLTKDIIP